ncbi:hypothetical protein FQA47_018373 [Oryzias melastigma]|uniref:Uncharacterized protein n=1 Tax=Oryzias melastigma TaxID=30732 RepID=A0A834F8N6_ORYME|nr:hypothetical protein FQA47_018373 [Oryzias melastigma]
MHRAGLLYTTERVLRCEEDEQEQPQSQRGRKQKKKSCQPLFPLFLSRSNVHQTKKHKHLNHYCFTSKGMAVVTTRTFSFLFLVWVGDVTSVRLTALVCWSSSARGRDEMT